MFEVHLAGSKINLGLIVVDMQNGFVAKGGSYDKLGMNTPSYREIIPKVKDLIDFCKSLGREGRFIPKQFGNLVE